MEHTDRQALYFSLHLGAALTSLFTEIALLSWGAGLTDSSAALAGGRLLVFLLAIIGAGMMLWPIPRRKRRSMLLSAAELWQLTALAAGIILLGFMAICLDC